jgi:predicted outer membrane repeat protein
VNLTNCVFDDNNTGTASANSSGSGQQGGAMTMNGYGTLTVKNCVFTNNTSFTSGGVLYTGASVTGSFSDCVFESNNVTEPAATPSGSSFSGSGGCFYIRSSLFDFTNCIFKNNSSPSIGGAVTSGQASTFTNCTFYGNTSQYGGAFYRSNNGSGTTTTTAAFINCTFSGNSASV